jgi:hypothetical protein
MPLLIFKSAGRRSQRMIREPEDLPEPQEYSAGQSSIHYPG